ncbi:hypothetical protein ES703_121026 [subsurface metagenome]
MFFLEGATGSATYNTITDLGYTGVGEYRSTGIGTYNAGVDIVFSHNEISLVQNAFALSTGTSGTIVEYNNVHDCHTGVRIEADAINSIVQYNDIHDNDFAIRCGATMGDGNEAHFNNFVNNSGLEWTNVDEAEPNTYVGAVCNVHATHILNATSNWWGTKVESEIAAMISGLVNYTLWLEAAPTWVEMTASSPGEIIGISVSPTSVDFGSLIPGTPSASQTVTVTNTGNVAEDFSTSLENISTPDVYTTGLAIDTSSANTWGASNVAVGGTAEPSLVLTVPGGTAPGTYTATLIFWAEAN